MEAINIKAYPNDISQIEAIKAVMMAFKIQFEITNTNDKKGYNPEFVAKIKQSKKEIENGNSIRVKKEDLKQFLGL
jgi:hypothetical protein